MSSDNLDSAINLLQKAGQMGILCARVSIMLFVVIYIARDDKQKPMFNESYWNR